jgi:transcriptional regulator with XRE-family HTH domain
VQESEDVAASAPDTEPGIEGELCGSVADLIPDPVSAAALPDFVALLEAEFAASEASENRARSVATSSLGAGEIVLTARELAGHSQRRLAIEVGTSQPSIATLEAGKRVPTIRTLIRIAEASRLELVVGLRRPGAALPVALGALVSSHGDGLADYLPMAAPSPFEGPPPNPA